MNRKRDYEKESLKIPGWEFSLEAVGNLYPKKIVVKTKYWKYFESTIYPLFNGVAVMFLQELPVS